MNENKYAIVQTGAFKKDLKLAKKRGYDLKLIGEVVTMLAEGKNLPPKYKDHSLSGNYAGCRECHITPDWLLIYEIADEELFLYLTRTGTHSDLLKKHHAISSASTENLARNLSWNPLQNLYVDLMHAQAEREAGYQGRSGDEVLADMRQIIAEAKSTANKDNPVAK